MVLRQFPLMRFQGEIERWESFEKKMEILGAIAEVFLEVIFIVISFLSNDLQL